MAGVLPNNRNYFLFSLSLLVVSVLIGYFFAPYIKEVIQQHLRELGRIVQSVEQQNNQAYLFWVILKNNVLAAVMMIGFGVFFAIMPIMGLFVNGMILGYILQVLGDAGVNVWKLLFLGILPHGAIELFAVTLAAAIGIKFGLLTLRLIGSVVNPNARSVVKRKFVRGLNELPSAVLLIVGLLFIAAVIESYITPQLAYDLLADVEAEKVRSLFGF